MVASMVPGRPRLLCVMAVATIAGLQTAPGRAEESPPAIRITCPELGVEERAALEARARAELSVAPLGDRSVDVDCGERRVVVVSLSGEDDPVERRVADNVRGAALVDELVNAVYTLVAEVRRDADRDASATGPPRPASPGEPRAKPEVDSDDVAVSPPKPAPIRFAVTSGADAELWSGALASALGGHLGARVSMRPRWAVELAGGAVWGLETGRSAGLKGRALRAALEVDYTPIPSLRIGLGADAHVLLVTGSGHVSPTAQSEASVGVLAAARFAHRFGRVELLGGPQVEVFAWPVIVQETGSEVFRLPLVVAGLSLEGAVDLLVQAGQ